MKLNMWITMLFYNPYYSPNVDYIHFDKIRFITKEKRRDILDKWDNINSFNTKKNYIPMTLNDPPHTLIWGCEQNKTQHILYMLICKYYNDTLEINYIISRPYCLKCDLNQMKKDIYLYNETLNIKYNLL
tara:strand:- start:134 stop:523 length:390 start_codon:yes stop_codon:yes gene_type:complete